MDCLAQLTDASLHSETKRLAGNSNTLTAQLLAHLGEVEARGIHRERACSSLYTYCVYELRMSEDEAQRRCRAARLARQFPILLEMLAEASLHLTGILLLGPHLTDENCAELLARARFRTKREIERLVAEIAPSCDVPSRIVPLRRAGAADWMLSPLDDDSSGLWVPPRNTWAAYVRGLAGGVRELEAGLGAGQAPPRADEQAAAATTGQESGGAECDSEIGARTLALDLRQADRHDGESGARTPAPDSRQDVSTPVPSGESQPTASAPPVTALRYKVQFTADQAYVDLLEEARNLLQHEVPARDLVAVQRRALELLVHKLRQRKYAAREHPGARAPEPVNGPPQPQPTPARPPVPQSVTRAPQSAPQLTTHAPHSAPPSKTHAPHLAVQSADGPQSQADARHAAPQSATDARRAAPQSATDGPWSQADARHSTAQPAEQSRYIPAEVRRSVWKRDEARCAYVDDRGQRCREQSGLEFHHQHPHARGGPPNIHNLALRCRSHNDLAAEQDFGRDVIREKRSRRRSLAKSSRTGAAP